ncbi:MAG: type VI secretion system membrane subunit TssM, partial [Proteobacteria bacterium]
MNAFFKGVGAVLGRVWVWSLILVLSCAVLVWCVGPLLAVDDHRFWQGATARLVTISVLFLLWGLAMVLADGRRAAGRERPDSPTSQPSLAAVEDERKYVHGRFKQALHRLNTSPRYGERNARWRHDLPWYLLIGESRSGKTQLLEAAGLQSPRDRMDTGSTGSSTQCEWYFADEAVLIDTPGRYLVQPDRSVDVAGWTTLLNRLRWRHRVRPLNGVVVTLSADRLLSG